MGFWRLLPVRTLLLVLGGALALAGCGPAGKPRAVETANAAPPCPAQPRGEVALPGGSFLLGAAGVRPEEGPPHRVTVGPFSIDRTEVTNGEFAAFVKATGYVTLAERQPDPKDYPGVDPKLLHPSAIVFVGADVDPDHNDPSRWWRIVDGANWRHPLGPKTSIAGKDREPVVQIAYQDALAYARWRGRDLPTEAEWEYAARGGLKDAKYSWGNRAADPAHPQANYWQGVFPAVDTGADGYKIRPAPVGCFPPNGYGLYDMAGNVWEWTSDWYRPGHDDETADDPLGPDVSQAFDPAEPRSALPKHVIKGGSFLCADDFCFRYRPAARQPGPPDTGASHLGFRTIKRGAPPAATVG
ncbi:formylglycine-generating enzyme family protein [Phenylobacterium sp.]|uniref:formylglycine-generating enzyme family protein n=1 Tax=Phenylobacterium sp. TaxID=1871053 RepID=UPI0035B116DF